MCAQCTDYTAQVQARIRSSHAVEDLVRMGAPLLEESFRFESLLMASQGRFLPDDPW